METNYIKVHKICEHYRKEYPDTQSDKSILDIIDPLLVNLNDFRHVMQVTYDPDTLEVPVGQEFMPTLQH